MCVLLHSATRKRPSNADLIGALVDLKDETMELFDEEVRRPPCVFEFSL
jgi:hypothetical protein